VVRPSQRRFKEICAEILASNGGIRFVGIADGKSRIIASEFRSGTSPLLSQDESALSFVLSIVKIKSDKALRPKLGNIRCSIALYEKIAIATMPLGTAHFLMVSLDRDIDHESIIFNDIWPVKAKIDNLDIGSAADRKSAPQ